MSLARERERERSEDTIRILWLNGWRDVVIAIGVYCYLLIAGEGFETVHNCNTKGSIDGLVVVHYMDSVILPLFEPPPSEEFPGIVLGDGVSTHFSEECIKWLIANYILFLLRVPHSTHETQDLDLVTYGIFKPRFRKAKQLKLRDMHRDWLAGGKRGPMPNLTGAHLAECCKEAWEYAFSITYNKKGWEMEGVIPFTRGPYWLKLFEEEDKKNHKAKTNNTKNKKQKKKKH